ncbi:MAG: RodZ domain-containing protein [Mycobacteriales bacterium]
MPTDDLTDDLTLGAALRQAREAAGMSVEDVSADTRIRATLVRDLEADRFTSSGGAVYARGHVKSIAATLKVDAAPLLALFDKAQGAEPVAAAMTGPEPVVDPSLGGSDFALSAAAALRPERRGPRWGVATSGAAAVLVALIAIGSLNNGGGGHPAALATTPTPTAASQPPVQASTPPDITASKPPISGAQLRVRVIGGSSWVSISNPTATLFEGILADGQFKDFRDPTRLKVVIGNSPVVSLNCNGKDSGPVAPNNHRVGHFSCTSAGLTSN